MVVGGKGNQSSMAAASSNWLALQKVGHAFSYHCKQCSFISLQRNYLRIQKHLLRKGGKLTATRSIAIQERDGEPPPNQAKAAAQLWPAGSSSVKNLCGDHRAGMFKSLRHTVPLLRLGREGQTLPIRLNLCER